MYLSHNIIVPVRNFRNNHTSTIIKKVTEREDLPKTTKEPEFKKKSESIGQIGEGQAQRTDSGASPTVNVAKVDLAALRDTDQTDDQEQEKDKQEEQEDTGEDHSKEHPEAAASGDGEKRQSEDAGVVENHVKRQKTSDRYLLL